MTSEVSMCRRRWVATPCSWAVDVLASELQVVGHLSCKLFRELEIVEH